MSNTLLITFGIAVLVALIVAFLVARAISKPIVGMTRAMSRLAEGDLDVDVPAQGRRDDIGNMAAAVEVFKQSAIKMRELGVIEEGRNGEARERTAAGGELIQNLMGVVDLAVAGDFSRRIYDHAQIRRPAGGGGGRQQPGRDGRSRPRRDRRGARRRWPRPTSPTA